MSGVVRWLGGRETPARSSSEHCAVVSANKGGQAGTERSSPRRAAMGVQEESAKETGTRNELGHSPGVRRKTHEPEIYAHPGWQTRTRKKRLPRTDREGTPCGNSNNKIGKTQIGGGYENNQKALLTRLGRGRREIKEKFKEAIFGRGGGRSALLRSPNIGDIYLGEETIE